MKTPISVTTKLPDSTGVAPVWNGSTSRPGSGFARVRQRNGSYMSPQTAREYEKIRNDDLKKQLASRAIMGVYKKLDLSMITSPRLKMRLGIA